MRTLLANFLTFTVLSVICAGQACAARTVTFGPGETKMQGSIKYSVIGRYTAHFNSFQGRITLDNNSPQVRSVYLNIEAGSIRSTHPRFDRLARSRRLLNTARYPKIIFKSDSITRDARGYTVRGVLEMHGIKRKLAFPFEARLIEDPRAKEKWLELKGDWVINRKDFNIIWNRYLDHGGILVSDEFVVDWGIRIYLK